MTRTTPLNRETASARFSSVVDAPMTIISFAWLPVLIVPLVHPLHGSLAGAFDLIDYVIWALFAVEYVIKLCLAPDRRRFFTHHLLDLAVVAIPMLRPLRLLRVLRSVAVLGNSTRRVRSILTHRGLHFVLLFAFVVVLACAALEQYFESSVKGSNILTCADALWWAVVTVTTVGYGDRFPVTAGGRGRRCGTDARRHWAHRRHNGQRRVVLR